ncbi:sulfite exporter TauE/SafE family protein [Streptomyces abyssomicinicus]|uniref:sulfite exporter TauE/SafE family protein n=1 Tax=Streptomyces abyssomicinicus TaxID=574929 RepID=UPI00125050B5|nr:sulfite exporter TauE/SafE family protein [Streptomyces abyssomicinicus]
MTALLLALLGGAVVGLTLGALGAGGSIVAVPALIYLLGFGPAEATTASLLIVIVTSLTALVAHARAGTVRWREGLLFAAAGVLPAAAAGLLSARVPGIALTLAFAVVAGTAGLRMLRRGHAPREGRVSGVRAAGAGAGLGAVTGFLGVGGGFLAVPALVSVLAVPITAAAGTSLLVIITNAVVALGARAGMGLGLDWSLILPFTAAAVLGAWDGRRIGAKIPAAALQRLFGGLLLAVGLAMGIGALV